VKSYNPKRPKHWPYSTNTNTTTVPLFLFSLFSYSLLCLFLSPPHACLTLLFSSLSIPTHTYIHTCSNHKKYPIKTCTQNQPTQLHYQNQEIQDKPLRYLNPSIFVVVVVASLTTFARLVHHEIFRDIHTLLFS